ncbi:MAG: hypothetical protein K6V97_11220 [Actinomycetia bacterium]|nr:hypothetical protein [Actinomycetes bacterium]
MRSMWRRAGALALVGLLLAGAWPGAARAADLPLYDVTLARQRLVQAASDNAATVLYSDIPVYLELPAGTQSFSTPNVIGSTIYQYTWDTAGNGWLWAVAMPALTAQQVTDLAGGTPYVTMPAQPVAPPIQFAAGFSGSRNEAAGQDSLSTGPYLNGQPDGAQYQAIAVGQNLYIWPASAYPTGGAPSGIPVYIQGNPGNTNYQVDDSPLITPPVTVQGIDSTGQPTTWQSPVAVVGSWDGGLVAFPVNVPSGDTAVPLYYQTSKDYSNSVAAITSDPTWVGAVPGVGQHCVAFGIAGAHPRVVLFDVTTGQWADLGVGEIAAQVADTTLYDPTSGTLFVQDIYGGLYAFDVATQALTAVYAPSSWTSTHEVLGQDMAWLPNSGATPSGYLIAIGGGGNVVGEFKPDLTPTQILTGYGPDVASPAVLLDAGGHVRLVFANGQGAIFLSGQDGAFALAAPPGTAYTGYLPDAGPLHALLGWTNRDPHGRPALVLYVTTPYAIQAQLSQTEVASGQPVTLTAWPEPAGVTYPDATNPALLNPYRPPEGGTAPVDFQVRTAAGQPLTPWWPLTHIKEGEWQASWTPPANTGPQPVTYTVVVVAVDNQDQEAPPVTLTLTVDPVAPSGPQPNSGGGTLSLTCGYGHGGLPIVVPHTCTIPAADQSEPATWFAYHPTVGAKFGDTIQATLTIPTPQLPALPGVQLTGVQLTASITHTVGTPNLPGYPGYNPTDPALYHYSTVTTLLTPSGGSLELSATGAFVESWAGYPPPNPLGTTVWQGTLTADWTAVVTYTYLVPCGKGCWAPATGQFTESGAAPAPLTVNGTDYYIIATPTGY